MVRKSTIAACVIMCAAGCGRPYAPMPAPNRPSGSITWMSTEPGQKPVPGIDQASVFFLGPEMVIWSAFARGVGSSSTTVKTIESGAGHMQVNDTQNVEFQYELTGRVAGWVRINGVRYDLADGGLFLLASGGEAIQVKQLKKDLSNVRFDRDTLASFARTDAEISEFFTKATGR